MLYLAALYTQDIQSRMFRCIYKNLQQNHVHLLTY